MPGAVGYLDGEVEQLRQTNAMLEEAFRETGRSLNFCTVCNVPLSKSIKNYLEHIRGSNHRYKLIEIDEKKDEAEQNQDDDALQKTLESNQKELAGVDVESAQQRLLEVAQLRAEKLDKIKKTLIDSVGQYVNETQLENERDTIRYTKDVEEIASVEFSLDPFSYSIFCHFCFPFASGCRWSLCDGN